MEGNKKNIFWFIIDSVRTFRTGEDDRDRINIMDKLAKESIEFTNCYTSAPSSLLAAGAMFTGLPAVFVARHFNDWKFDNENISTIKTLVEEHGYTSIPLIDGRNAREKYQNLLSVFPSSYLPKGKHLRDYVWNNEEVTEIFEHIIKTKQFKEPFVFTFWYDCRRDPKTSEHVERAFNLIKKHGYYDDSIIIMNSDHGYPDPRTKLDKNFFKGLGHDMILSDDNVKTPLLIKYPDAPKNVKISNVVGHVDIIPTIFDVIDIPIKKDHDVNEFSGKSLIPIIDKKEDDERVRRFDTRLTMDVGRITALRSHEYKYIIFHDDKIEALYNLENDPKEITNLLDKSKDENKMLDNFRTIMKDYEAELFAFHKKTLKKIFNDHKKKFRTKSANDKILIVSPAPKELLQILVFFVSRDINPENINVASIGQSEIGQIDNCKVLNIKSVNDDALKELHKMEFYSTVYLTHNSRRVFLKSDIIKSIRSIKSRKKYLMNYNFQMIKYFSSFPISSYLKLFFDWDIKGYFYKQEPQYFLRDLMFFFNHTMKKLINRKKVSGDIMTAREIMEYRNHQLKKIDDDIQDMDNQQLEYEVGRIKDWGKE